MPKRQEVPEDLIRQRSYQIWEEEGCPDGRAQEHWFRAKAVGTFVSPRPRITSPPRKRVAREYSHKEGAKPPERGRDTQSD